MQVRNGKMQMVGSILVGGIIGAGIALLFAPQSGRRTRRDIRHIGKKVLNKSQAIGMDLRNSIEHVADDISDKVQEAVGAGKARLQGGLYRIRRAS